MASPPDISITAKSGEAHGSFLREKLLAAWQQLAGAGEAPAGALSVAIVDDATMSGIHERFLSVEGTTDVLTFELEHRPDGTVEEGEVVICFDEAVRQADERGHPVEEELLLYAVHGLLHLSGYDDRDPAAYDRMHAREDELLEAIGIGRRFRS